MAENEDMGIPDDCYIRKNHVVFDMDELIRYVMFRELLSASVNEYNIDNSDKTGI
jgi:exonuclease I